MSAAEAKLQVIGAPPSGWCDPDTGVCELPDPAANTQEDPEEEREN